MDIIFYEHHRQEDAEPGSTKKAPISEAAQVLVVFEHEAELFLLWADGERAIKGVGQIKPVGTNVPFSNSLDSCIITNHVEFIFAIEQEIAGRFIFGDRILVGSGEVRTATKGSTFKVKYIVPECVVGCMVLVDRAREHE